MADIVLFGATGYTGQLTARALVARGQAPVLAGRNRAALKALGKELGGLSVRIADVADAVSVRKIVKSGDVLVSTVGPFARYGKPALDAALAGKAHYLDSTGEPGFVRQVFEDYDARVKATGKAFITAFGYDYVPGNTAAAAALEKAGKNAVRVDVGYFVAGGAGFGMSQGTRASLVGAMVRRVDQSLPMAANRAARADLAPVARVASPSKASRAHPDECSYPRRCGCLPGERRNLSGRISP